MRSLGWNAPTKETFAQLRFNGLSSSFLLQDTEAAESADATAFVEILDQGPLGSCVAQAVSQIIRGKMLQQGAPTSVPFPSRLWSYTMALAKQGDVGKDVGTNIGTMLDVLAQAGFPPESEWPYDVSQFGRKPPLAAHHAALDQEAVLAEAYHPIVLDGDMRASSVRQALTAGNLVAFGTPVTEVFVSSDPGGAVVQRPQPGAPIAGGHAMVVAGFEIDPATGRVRFRIANSWGKGWGESGFFWMDVDYLTWSSTSDLWIVSRAPVYSGT